MFNKNSTIKDFWMEVLKFFLIILAVFAVVAIFSVGATLLIKLLGPWTLIPVILLIIFGGSVFAIYLEWRNKW